MRYSKTGEWCSDATCKERQAECNSSGEKNAIMVNEAVRAVDRSERHKKGKDLVLQLTFFPHVDDFF